MADPTIFGLTIPPYRLEFWADVAGLLAPAIKRSGQITLDELAAKLNEDEAQLWTVRDGATLLRDEAKQHVLAIKSASDAGALRAKWSQHGLSLVGGAHLAALKQVSMQVRPQVSYPALSAEDVPPNPFPPSECARCALTERMTRCSVRLKGDRLL